MNKRERGLLSRIHTAMALPGAPRLSHPNLKMKDADSSRRAIAHMRMNEKVTPEGNFEACEFYSSSEDGHFKDVAPPDDIMGNVRHLAEQLEVIRAHANKLWGGAKKAARVTITQSGGYRTEEHNERKGGADKSRHLTGEAGDLRIRIVHPGAGATSYDVHPTKVRWLVLYLIESGEIDEGGVGLYPTFVHYDTRGKAARWDET